MTRSDANCYGFKINRLHNMKNALDIPVHYEWAVISALISFHAIFYAWFPLGLALSNIYKSEIAKTPDFH